MRVSPISNSSISASKTNNPNFSGSTYTEAMGEVADLIENNRVSRATVHLLAKKVKACTSDSLIVCVETMPQRERGWVRASMGPSIEDVQENIKISYQDAKNGIKGAIGAYLNPCICPEDNISILWSALNKKAPNIFIA